MTARIRDHQSVMEGEWMETEDFSSDTPFQLEKMLMFRTNRQTDTHTQLICN